MIIGIDVFVWSFGISILSSICRCGRRVGWWTTRHPCADRILTNSGNPIKWKCILSMFIIKQYRQRCVVAFFAATINSNPKQMRIHYKNIHTIYGSCASVCMHVPNTKSHAQWRLAMLCRIAWIGNECCLWRIFTVLSYRQQMIETKRICGVGFLVLFFHFLLLLLLNRKSVRCQEHSNNNNNKQSNECEQK